MDALSQPPPHAFVVDGEQIRENQNPVLIPGLNPPLSMPPVAPNINIPILGIQEEIGNQENVKSHEFPPAPEERIGICTSLEGEQFIFLAAPPDKVPFGSKGYLTIIRQRNQEKDGPEETEVWRGYGAARYHLKRATILQRVQPGPGEIHRLNSCDTSIHK